MAKLRNKKLRFIMSFILLTTGCVIAALSLETFLIPNTILDGGVTGIGIIISKLFGISLGLLVLILNIPFVFIGYKNLGKNFLIRTVYSMIVFSICLTFFHTIGSFTEDKLLASIFGGVILGAGVGLVIRSGGCVDGTESVAIVVSKKTSLSVGQVVLIFNLFIYTVAGFIFGFDRAMYSLFTYFVTFKVIDFVSEGLEQAKAALIVTSYGGKLSQEIYEKLGRTTTTIRGRGLISGEKEVLYCVLTRVEVYELRKIIDEMDESAFVTILEVSDIIGDHIKSTMKERRIKG